MSLANLVWQTLLFGFTFWLGCYLIARDPARLLLWLAGGGTVIFALGVGTALLSQFAPSIELALWLSEAQRLFAVLPALFWLGAMIWLIPTRATWEERYGRQPLLLGAAMFCILVYGVVISVIVIRNRQTLPAGLATLTGLDLIAFGLVITWLDASDKGEAWLSHILRSFDYTFFTALIFGGQVIIVMTLWTGMNFPLVTLLLTSVAAAAVIQTFSAPVQLVVDRIAFFNAPQLRLLRAVQRAEDNAAQRVDLKQNPLNLEDKEFKRLTRQALSQMSNLPKLASNPLTRLPLVTERIAQSGQGDSTLARAAELKAILTESIVTLKPREPTTFGTTNAWRHYNALFFLM